MGSHPRAQSETFVSEQRTPGHPTIPPPDPELPVAAGHTPVSAFPRTLRGTLPGTEGSEHTL